MSKTTSTRTYIPYKTNIKDKNLRSLITPEGIALQLRLADGGTRVGAFVIDIIIMVLSLTALMFFLIFTIDGMSLNSSFEGSTGSQIAEIVWILGAFILRNFYFMFFEMGGKGATPGKRLMKIRVANRKGSHLTANAVFARNALREIEFFLPLGLMFSFSDGVDGWMNFLAFVWSLIFLMFPLFNKDRLRAGDLIAGTWVVNAPRTRLSKDLSAAPKTGGILHDYRFTPTHIDTYGVKELHVLENVLRQKNPDTVAEVAERIMNKLKWPDADKVMETPKEQYAFLSAFYAALRGKLETKLLFGVRREDKFDKR